MPWRAESGQTFGDYMRGGLPLGEGRTADVVTGERTWATEDQVREGRTDDGGRYKTTRDQLGHQVTERTDARGCQRQDVQINLR